MKVKWRVDIDQYQDPMTGEIEVDDNALDEDIDLEVREDMWNTMSLTWEIVVDGSALVEREACARVVENWLKDASNRHRVWSPYDFAEVAALIRARPK